MFSTELKYCGRLSWNYCNKNIKILKIPVAEKITFEKSNSVDWENKKCVIFTFPLDTDICGPQTNRDGTTYMDFIIRKDYKFLRDIYPKETT